MPTVNDVFTQKKLWAWFNSPVTNPYDGTSEKGQDYSTTYGTPVAVPVGGTVQRITHNSNAINDQVEILCSDSSVWLYQHITAKVSQGDTLQCGSVVGTENGLPIDQYSTGPHIEVRYAAPGTWKSTVSNDAEPWVNPAQIFGAIGAQPAGTVAKATGIAGIVGSLPVVGNGALSLAPNADVSLFLWTLDQLLDLTNPFNVNATTDNLSVAGASVSFTDPVEWVAGFGLNLVEDAVALLTRTVLVVLGVLILYKVASAFIDFGSIGQAVSGVGELAGGFA